MARRVLAVAEQGPPRAGESPVARGDCVCGRTGLRLRTSRGHQGELPKHRYRTPSGWSAWCERRTLVADNIGPAPTAGLVSWPTDPMVEAMGAAFDRAVLYGTGDQQRRDELATWWREMADGEIDMVVDKAIEYSATDLRDLGRAIYDMAGRPQPDDPTATEAGIAFYMLGKMGRVVGAFREGRLPSSDTWLDLGVYARMAQRVRQTGAWPGV